ncbi:MAG: pyridoxamine 5'-phosphate oxidase family protein [Rickettsiales bacterium]|nr:pyridoxamine 5'-phosphate oxidase family protein [Rickettsiales bacterium]
MSILEAGFPAIWRAVSEQISLAAQGRGHPWHLMNLATISPDGFPEARTVVLREFEQDKPALWFHSDARSPKVLGLEISDGDVELMVYDPKQRRQLRCRGKAILHHADNRARMRWDASKDSSRRCYMAGTGPSERVESRDSTLPAAVTHKVPTHAEAEPGFLHFTAVECRINYIDVLQLNALGGERCKLHFQQGELEKGEWLAP